MSVRSAIQKVERVCRLADEIVTSAMACVIFVSQVTSPRAPVRLSRMFFRYWFPIAIAAAGDPELAGDRPVCRGAGWLRRPGQRVAGSARWPEPSYRPALMGRLALVLRPARPSSALFPQAQAQATGRAEHILVEEEHRGPSRQSAAAMAAEKHSPPAPIARPAWPRSMPCWRRGFTEPRRPGGITF